MNPVCTKCEKAVGNDSHGFCAKCWNNFSAFERKRIHFEWYTKRGITPPTEYIIKKTEVLDFAQ